MSDALQRLIEAVEAGSNAPFHDLTYSQLDTFGQRFIDLTQQANRGDLNAAKALHDALLPGWRLTGLGQCVNYYGDGSTTPNWFIRLDHSTKPQHAEGISLDPARTWLLAILRAYQQVQTPAEQLAEAILSAAGSGLRHYTAASRERIMATAERWIEDARLNAICDERKADGGIPVSLGELQWPAVPLEPTPQPRNDPAGSTGPSDTINAPHGAENGADNG